MSAQIALQPLEPSQYYFDASPNEKKTSQAHLLILEVLAKLICNPYKCLSSIEFAKTVSSQKVLEAWPGTSSQSAWCVFSNVHRHARCTSVNSVFVTEALLHQSLLFVCCPP